MRPRKRKTPPIVIPSAARDLPFLYPPPAPPLPCRGTASPCPPTLGVGAELVPTLVGSSDITAPHPNCHFERSRPTFSLPPLPRRVGLRREKSLFAFLPHPLPHQSLWGSGLKPRRARPPRALVSLGNDSRLVDCPKQFHGS
jgi:hypothetical protein